MNKYVRAAITIPFGAIKMSFTWLFHPVNFRGTLLSMLSPYTEITIDKGGSLRIGRIFKMRDGAKIRVRKNGSCNIGHHVALGSHSMIVCHDAVSIGNAVQLSPNVQIYDHDHDFRVKGGINEKKFCTAPIEIGDNVWIGANTVILRGTKIGANSVIGAGCILKGEYPAGSVVVQRRLTEITGYQECGERGNIR